MGLDTTHDCWHGPYSMFHRWRYWLAAQIGLPLGMMEGFCEATFTYEDLQAMPMRTAQDADIYAAAICALANRPIPWDLLNGEPLVVLLNHSDCDGRIPWWKCKALAIRLGQIARTAKNDTESEGPARGCYDGMVPATKRFALGCLRAWRAREDVIFH